MGKRARKTRWRTLTITDEPSDSEESSTTTAQRIPKGYHPKSYYNKFPYSSQSTPRRRYQYDGTKSTRSSSTASENKITFNEDEYTRITTPRQDVLFKKGYLNKPKNYQTQTSTGTSTTSTGNSTGNGTPDHQSTDLEYESQFVFPNGFVDQNGIYYVNGYESYPLMLYNPPTYFPEYSTRKSKRYSTGSLTESMSPNNEEATSQDLSGGETNNVSDYSGHHAVYNMIYPGYYVNGVCPPHDVVNGQSTADQNRRIKKRRRRKASKSQTAHDSSEYTEDESDSGDEEKSAHPDSKEKLDSKENGDEIEENEEIKSNIEPQSVPKEEPEPENEEECSPSIESEAKKENSSLKEEKEEKKSPESHQTTSEATEDEEHIEHLPAAEENPQNPLTDGTEPTKSNLKPDAEEFVPRAYRGPETPINSIPPFIKVPPNFVPIPVLPLGEFNGQNFNPAFIPPGIPINFLPPDPKLFPNFVGFVPNNFAPKNEAGEGQASKVANVGRQTSKKENCDNFSTAKVESGHQNREPAEKIVVQTVNSKTIDIATIVSKLEEAAKEQEDQDNIQPEDSPRRRFPENKYSRGGQKHKNYRRSYYSPHASPQKKNYLAGSVNGDDKTYNKQVNPDSEDNTGKRNDTTEGPNGVSSTEVSETVQEAPRQLGSPEKTKKIWKPHYQNGNPKWHQNNTSKDFRNRQNGKIYGENDVRDYRTKQNYRNYSDTLAIKTQTQAAEPKNPEKECNSEKPQNDSPKSETNIENVKPTASPTKKSNQWISVSNRKKRKNKSVEENDVNVEVRFEEDTEDHSNIELFESYDVNLLVDVMPTSVQSEVSIEVKEEVQEIKTVEENESISINDKETLDTEVAAASDEQQELIKFEILQEGPVELESPVEDITIVDDTAIVKDIVDLAELNLTSVVETNDKAKKKSKKGTQKPLTKRVIITDLDLSMKKEEIKAPVKKVVTKLNDGKAVSQKAEEKPDVVNKDFSTTTVVEKAIDGNEEDKKKSKKKKKKTSKLTTTSSLSSSNATLNVDDSYDFLLDTALSDESIEKTNVEVSQELDKLIQRGMYNCLEEKIKSLNIDESDGFFKSIFSTITSRESSVDKTGYAQTPDLTKMLQNTRTFCPPSSVSEENNSQNKDINTVLPDLDSPDEDGLVLDDPDTNETQQDRTLTNEPIEVTTDAETQSYPITQAVKEWMNKSREKTPDVVLLKSPSAIFKEFCDSASESDNDTNSNSSSSDDLVTANGDEELTTFTEEARTDADLDDVGMCEETNDCYENNSLIGTDDKYIEEGEDVVEVYDSKYGKNEDYLHIQEEVKITANASNQRHRNMPYRAICCSIV